MRPSGAMRTHGVTGMLASVFACACDIRRTPSLPTAMQNAIPPKPARTPRRERLVSIMFMAQALPRCALDGGDDAVIGPTAADIAVHVGDDVGARGLGILGEQLRGLHDLPGLAVAALRHLFDDPGLLQRVGGIGRQAFDGDDGLARHRADIELARALRDAVDVNGAGAAEAGAAAVLGAGQSDVVANGPQQRRAGVGVERDLSIVQGERDHASSCGLTLSSRTPPDDLGRRKRGRGLIAG